MDASDSDLHLVALFVMMTGAAGNEILVHFESNHTPLYPLRYQGMFCRI